MPRGYSEAAPKAGRSLSRITSQTERWAAAPLPRAPAGGTLPPPRGRQPALPRTVPPPARHWTLRTLRASSPDNRQASPSLQRRTEPAKRPPSAYRRDRPPPEGCSPGWPGRASAGELSEAAFPSAARKQASWLLFLPETRPLYLPAASAQAPLHLFSFPDRPTSCFFPPAFVVYGRCSVD